MPSKERAARRGRTLDRWLGGLCAETWSLVAHIIDSEGPIGAKSVIALGSSAMEVKGFFLNSVTLFAMPYGSKCCQGLDHKRFK